MPIPIPLTPIDIDMEGECCPCPCPAKPLTLAPRSPEADPCPLDAADKLRGGTKGGPIGPPPPAPPPSPIADILGEASTPTFLFAPRYGELGMVGELDEVEVRKGEEALAREGGCW